MQKIAVSPNLDQMEKTTTKNLKGFRLIIFYSLLCLPLCAQQTEFLVKPLIIFSHIYHAD